MRFYLILYIMSFNAEGQLVEGYWVEQPHASYQACTAALDVAIKDWGQIVLGKSRTGIVGRCSDQPLNAKAAALGRSPYTTAPTPRLQPLQRGRNVDVRVGLPGPVLNACRALYRTVEG